MIGPWWSRGKGSIEVGSNGQLGLERNVARLGVEMAVDMRRLVMGRVQGPISTDSMRALDLLGVFQAGVALWLKYVLANPSRL